MTSIPDNLKGTIGKAAAKKDLRDQRAHLIEKMWMDGQRISDIARAFCVHFKTIENILQNLGHDTGSRNIVSAKFLLRGETPVPPTGQLRAFLEREPAHFVAWLLAETPDGCTMAETLIAIARDTYAEEMDAKRGKAA